MATLHKVLIEISTDEIYRDLAANIVGQAWHFAAVQAAVLIVGKAVQ